MSISASDWATEPAEPATEHPGRAACLQQHHDHRLVIDDKNRKTVASLRQIHDCTLTLWKAAA